MIAPPEIEITAGQDDGDVEFDAVVEVRPQVQLVGYDELPRRAAVSRPSPTTTSTSRSTACATASPTSTDSDFPLIDDALRHDRHHRHRSTASPSRVSPRPTSSTASVPAWSSPSSTSSCAAPSPARSSSSTRRLPERFGDRAGEDGQASASSSRKRSTRCCPSSPTSGSSEASEFDTVDELRADIRKRLEMMQKLQAQMAVRDKVLEAVADLVPDRGAGDARRRRDAPTRRGPRAPAVSIRTRSLEQYLEATGQEPQAFIDEVRDRRCSGGARRSRAARSGRAGRDCRDRRRGRRRDRTARRAHWNRSSKRCGASSNGAVCWRRYALMLHVGKRSNSSSSTPQWSTRTGT